MSIPFPSRPAAPSRRTDCAAVPPVNSGGHEWRCSRCAKLLGLCHTGHVHLRFTRGHEYLVGYPVTATCRSCSTLNRRDASLPAA